GRVCSENQPAPGSGVDSIAVTVASQNSLRSQSRQVPQEAETILQFYSSLMGDAPYTSAAIALLESDLPGGHSPGYFAVLNTPTAFAAVNWRGDPASFDNFPQFFLAHELAHQWWGQAIGWKNYHEQWISEGFHPYFAAAVSSLVAFPIRPRSCASRIAARTCEARPARFSGARLQQRRGSTSHA